MDSSLAGLLKELSDQKLALDQSSIVAMTDEKGTIRYVNDKFCQVSGYSRDELIGKTHKIINSGYHSKSFFAEMWKIISEGHVWKGELKNRNKSGNFYWVDTTIVPFLGSDGKPYQYLAVRHEITALKEAEKIIMDQQSKLAVASKFSALGEMAANLTHEINNPLSVILGRCEMLLHQLSTGDCDTQRVAKMVENIEVTAHRIEKIIKSMRSFSVARDNDPFVIIPVYDVISQTLDFVQQRFKDHGVVLSLIPFDQSLNVECRDTEVSQILLNLLNNAFDAVSKLQEKWVRLEVTNEGDRVCITITDSGSGIPDSIQNRIFDPFFSTKEKQYGTGLGLSISRGLADKNNAIFELDEANTNTSFKLHLLKRQKKVGEQ